MSRRLSGVGAALGGCGGGGGGGGVVGMVGLGVGGGVGGLGGGFLVGRGWFCRAPSSGKTPTPLKPEP